MFHNKYILAKEDDDVDVAESFFVPFCNLKTTRPEQMNEKLRCGG